jgi:hypothetical protein
MALCMPDPQRDGSIVVSGEAAEIPVASCLEGMGRRHQKPSAVAMSSQAANSV